MQGSVYLIINTDTGHKYIGNTTSMLNKEWKHHIECARRMSREPLHIAMRKYGNHTFNIKEIDACNELDLIEKTEYWIGRYKPEYNDSDIIIEEPPTQTFTIKEKKPKNIPTFTDENRGTGKHSGIRIQSMNIETGELKEWENARVAAAELARVKLLRVVASSAARHLLGVRAAGLVCAPTTSPVSSGSFPVC